MQMKNSGRFSQRFLFLWKFEPSCPQASPELRHMDEPGSLQNWTFDLYQRDQPGSTESERKRGGVTETQEMTGTESESQRDKRNKYKKQETVIEKKKGSGKQRKGNETLWKDWFDKDGGERTTRYKVREDIFGLGEALGIGRSRRILNNTHKLSLAGSENVSHLNAQHGSATHFRRSYETGKTRAFANRFKYIYCQWCAFLHLCWEKCFVCKERISVTLTFAAQPYLAVGIF